MLRITRDLVATLADAHRDDVVAACAVIRKCGARDDAAALVHAFLAAPDERTPLLSPVRAHGDAALARALYDAAIDGEQLREGMPSEVLHTIGHLGLREAESALLALATSDEADYSVARDAALGLIDLPSTRGGDIALAIAKHEGSPLFPELLPSLACKTGDGGWTRRLVRWGRDASTDCNGGLILGIALLGDRAAFESVLWDRSWEAHDTATGTRTWSYLGARALGFDMRELYATLKSRCSELAPEPHMVRVLAALLELWIEPPLIDLHVAPESTETARELRALLFRWSTPHRDDSLVGLAHGAFPGDHRIHGDLASLEHRLNLLARFELELAEREPSSVH